METEALLTFLLEIDRLKNVDRQTLLHNGGRPENSAEHSWHLAMAVLVFHSLARPEVNLLKSIKMALLHDLVEIDAGDTFVYADQSSKNANENAAINRITGLLPKHLGEDLRQTWQEFESGVTAEAQFVSGLDRFLPLFSNCLNQGHSWKKHGISFDRVLSKNQKPIEEALPDLWRVAHKLLNESCIKGDLSKSS